MNYVTEPVTNEQKRFVMDYIAANVSKVKKRFRHDKSGMEYGTTAEFKAIAWFRDNGLEYKDLRLVETGHDFLVNGIKVDVKATATVHQPHVAFNLNINNRATHTCEYFMGYSMQYEPRWRSKKKDSLTSTALIGFVTLENFLSDGKHYQADDYVFSSTGKRVFKTPDPMSTIQFGLMLGPDQFLEIVGKV